jgi:hypothetical protein
MHCHRVHGVNVMIQENVFQQFWQNKVRVTVVNRSAKRAEDPGSHPPKV